MKTINTYYEGYSELDQFVKSNYDILFANDNRAVLVQVFSGNCDRNFLTVLSKQITGLVPHAHIIGATTGGEIMNGKVSGLKIVLSFSVFQHSDIKTVLVAKGDKNDYELGQLMATVLNSDKAKVLILFATGLTVNAGQMLKGVQSVNPDLPVVGGNAADNFVHQKSFVFCNEDITDCGVVGVALSGEVLTINRHWHLGWQPIGKEMTITKADDLRVYTIDNIPAFQIYQKYFGLDKGADINKVSEFPLIACRSGIQMARIPHARYDDDSIGFVAELVKGERVRFSFGNIDIVLEMVDKLLRKIEQQSAESIFVYSCVARRRFLQELVQDETLPLQEIAPVAGFFTYGEFFHADKTNQLLNSTMTIVVLSESGGNEKITPTKSEVTAYSAELKTCAGVKRNNAIDRNTGVLKSLTHLVNIVTEELQKANENLQYTSFHDSLTGIYNRSFFEQEMDRFKKERNISLGIIICDIDGLKLVNDALGHVMGDATLTATAHILKSVVPLEAVLALIWGGEFAVLLQNSSLSILESLCFKIRNNVAHYNDDNPGIPLSISVGCSFSNKEIIDTNSLFKEAQTNMYREKLLHSQSTRSALVKTLMKTLEARDFITEGHCERLGDLTAKLAEACGLAPHLVVDLRLLAQFHDIGKVGIPDHILFKPGRLNLEEKKEMQRHSEIGYNIAQSSADLLPIAEWILHHHEWWNGTGYPLELEGETIPIECRILTIVDAYDAMTNDRPYRKAMSHSFAIEELKRGAGIQFDPELVKIFIEINQLQHRGSDSIE